MREFFKNNFKKILEMFFYAIIEIFLKFYSRNANLVSKFYFEKY